MVKRTTAVVLRPKRQITLPKEICQQLGIEPGDGLELSLEGSALIARPQKAVALEALKEIQETFKRSGITEEELLQAGREVRREIINGSHANRG